ncbi:MAG: tRNA threonylcarbamoyladenosine dehydratase [Thermodesulfobacteriota bacterium]
MKMARFSRIKRLLGEESFAALQQSRVTVVGIGAVGGYAVEGLARAGVGGLRLVDFDTFEASNINRQLHALESTLGRSKVEVAKERVLEINPACQVETVNLFVDPDNLDQLLTPRPQLILDAIDSVESKVALLSQAWQGNIPVLSAMGAALRRDPTLIRLADLHKTQKCPLARQVRRRLHRAGVGEGIGCVYSLEEASFASQSPLAVSEEEEGGAVRPLGSLPTITGIFGLTLANEAIRLLTSP